jgi:hypothetical protein
MRKLLLLGAVTVCWALPATTRAIPYFARKYSVECARCHVLPPALNTFGEGFVAAGYRSPELRPSRTVPLAVWLSGRSESLPMEPPEDDHQLYGNRVELISGDALTPWLSYFVEWRVLSNESRANGTLRDRSGRFEDIFVTLMARSFDLTAGQFRPLAQVDVSRRLSLSEPLVLSSGLGGTGTGSGRLVGLRGFSPSGRSPAIRGSITLRPREATRWVTGLTIPFPGELSIPLTDSADVQASNEFESKAKGVFVESFVRRDLLSLGGHVFYDESDRYLANVIGTASRGMLHLTGAAGVVKSGTTSRQRFSLELWAVPRPFVGLGVRLEDQMDDNLPRALLPHLNLHWPGTSFTLRLTLEQRLQEFRNTTLLELGAVF